MSTVTLGQIMLTAERAQYAAYLRAWSRKPTLFLPLTFEEWRESDD